MRNEVFSKKKKRDGGVKCSGFKKTYDTKEDFVNLLIFM